MSSHEIHIPTELVKAITAGDAVLFIGAGLSMGAGLPSWPALLEPLAESIELPEERRSDLLQVAQDYANARSPSDLINHVITETDTTGIEPTENHRRLARLGVRTWMTTNYDNLLEKTLDDAGHSYRLVVRDADLPHTTKTSVTLIKLHGDRAQPETIVITRSDYHTHAERHPQLYDRLSDLLATRTFLFLGYSVSDPDFNLLRDVVGYRLKEQQRPAYVLLFDEDEWELNDLRNRNIHPINLETEAGNHSERLGEFLEALIEAVDSERGHAVRIPPARRQQSDPTTIPLIAPPPPDTFAGRTRHLKTLTTKLTAGEDVAISVAVAGLGGVGKTTLAKKLGREVAPAFPGGVLWLDLGYEADLAALVEQAALKLNLDLGDEPDPEARARIVQATLAQRDRLLAILDDCWDVDLGRWLRDNLLPADRVLLVTSRSTSVSRALCTYTERLDRLPQDEALALLENVFDEPLAGYEEAAKNFVDIVDGLPLALELGAKLCDNGAADLPWLVRKLATKPALDILNLEGEEVRESSVEACLKLSYDGLNEEMQRRFRALGVFAPAPFDLPALAAVWDDEDLEADDDAARHLQRRGLLDRAEDRLPEEAEPAQPVYRQHSLLRAYALALLQQEDEVSAAADRHTDYYQTLPGDDWRAGDLFWEQIEHGWEHAITAGIVRALGFYNVVGQFLELRGHTTAYIHWVTALLDSNAVEEREHATLLNNIGQVYSSLGKKQQALDYYEQALPLCRKADHAAGEAATLNNIGTVYSALGEKQQALNYYEQALPLCRKAGHTAGEAATLNNIGTVYDALGEKQQALSYYKQALPLRRQVGDKADIAQSLNNIGAVYDALGEKQQALSYYEQALPLRRQVGDTAGEAITLNNIGAIHFSHGEYKEALEYGLQAVDLDVEIGPRWDEVLHRRNVAIAYRELGELEETQAQLEQVIALDEALGHPDLESDREMLEQVRKMRRTADRE